MKKNSYHIFSLVAACVFLNACKKESIKNQVAVQATAGPVINNFFPAAFQTGDTVNIQGVNFSDTLSKNMVLFGDSTAKTAGTVIAGNNLQLQVIVPTISKGGQITVMVNKQSAVSGNYAYSQWKKVTSMPGDVTAYGFSFTLGTKVYYGGGESVPPFTASSVIYYQKMYAYDTVAHSWTAMANFIGAARSHTACFTLNGKAYVGTGVTVGYGSSGITSRTEYKDFYEYNPATNTWRKVADFPGTGRVDATAFSINNKGYVGLGASSQTIFGTLFTCYQDLYSFDPVANTWLKLANYPGTARRLTATYVYKNIAYVGLGRPAQTPLISVGLPDFYAYNPLSNTWTVSTPAPGALYRAGAIAFVYGTKAYIGCANYYLTSNSSGLVGEYTPYIYDLTAATWNTGLKIPVLMYDATNESATYAVPGGGGGGFGSTDGLNYFYKANANNVWQYKP
jgi:N-acetylneuraminic acid mutarotase